MIQQTVTNWPATTNILPRFIVDGPDPGEYVVAPTTVYADTFIIDNGSLVFTAMGMGGRYLVAAFAPGHWTRFTQMPRDTT